LSCLHLLNATTGTTTGLGRPGYPDDSTEPASGPVGIADAVLPGADDEQLAEANAARENIISSAGRYGTKSRTPNPRRSAITRSTKQTPTPAWPDTSEALPGWATRVHYLVDCGKGRVILTALVTKADVKDNQPILDLPWHTTFRWKLRPHHVTGDSVYGTIPNVKALE
jgi:hypothetical protein